MSNYPAAKIPRISL